MKPIDIDAIRKRWESFIVADLGTIHHDDLLRAVQDIYTLLHVIHLMGEEQAKELAERRG